MNTTHWLTLAALSTVLAACGGSGSSGSTTDSPNNDTVDVTPDTSTEQESTVPAIMDAALAYERLRLNVPVRTRREII